MSEEYGDPTHTYTHVHINIAVSRYMCTHNTTQHTAVFAMYASVQTPLLAINYKFHTHTHTDNAQNMASSVCLIYDAHTESIHMIDILSIPVYGFRIKATLESIATRSALL